MCSETRGQQPLSNDRPSPAAPVNEPGGRRRRHDDDRRPVYRPRVERGEEENQSFFYPLGLRTDQMDLSIPPSEGERRQGF